MINFGEQMKFDFAFCSNTHQHNEAALHHLLVNDQVLLNQVKVISLTRWLIPSAQGRSF